MRNCSGNSYYGSPQPSCSGLISGNSVDVNLNQNDSEVRVDIDVARINTIRIWGQVLDCDGTAISNALVKLVKPINVNGTCEFQGVAHCVSDCNGFYQFDVPSNGDYNYKILVGKSAYSNERIICGHEGTNPKSSCQYKSYKQNSNAYQPPYEQYTSCNSCYEAPKNTCESSYNCNYEHSNYDSCSKGTYDQYNSNCDGCNQNYNYDSCNHNYDTNYNSNYAPNCNSNYEPCKPAYEHCKQSYEPYEPYEHCNKQSYDSNKPVYDSCSSNCDPCNQNYEQGASPYKMQSNGNCECSEGENKYSTYYYSEPETLE